MSYHEVIEFIENEIKTGSLKSGRKLPNASIIASELNCSKDDVLKAYNIFVDNKLAYDIKGHSFYLMKNPERLLISEKIYFDKLHFRPSIIKETDLFYISGEGAHENLPGGHKNLLNALIDYYKKQNIHINSENLVVASHMKEAFKLIIEGVLEKDQGLLIENPTHPDLIKEFEGYKNIATYNKIDHMDFNLLELLFIQKKIKLFVLQGDESLPYGNALTLEEKIKLLDLCDQYDVYLVDIDFALESKLYIEGQSLYGLDLNEKVFHLKTYHQYFSQNLKLVTMIVPDKYKDKLTSLKQEKYGETSLIEQLVLYQVMIKDFDYFRKFCRETIKERYDVFLGLYKTYKNQLNDIIQFNQQKSHMFIEVNSAFDLKTMALAMKQKNIKMADVNTFYLAEDYKKGFVLSLTYHDKTQLEKGFTQIFDYLLEHKEATWL